MKTRSTLRLYILALVLFPLIIQIGMLVALTNLLREADEELERSIRAQKINDGISSINKQLYDAFFMYTTEKDEDLLSKEAMAPTIAKFRKTYDELEELTKDDPRALAIIKRSDAAATRTVELMEILRAAKERDGVTEQARKFRRPYWFELRNNTKKVVTPEFLNLRHVQEQVSEASPLIQKEIRQKIQYGLWGCIIALTALLSYIAFHLTRDIANKIARLKDNTMRLASNVPLNPVMQENDDLSQLDQVFHKMAHELQAAARKERALLDNARDFICSIDKSGKFVEANAASEFLIGYKPDELLGSHLIDFLAQNDVSHVLAYFDKIQEGDKEAKIAPLETQLRHKNGSTIDVTGSAQFAREENLTFCVFHDTTEKRQAERLRQEVVAMVTHDLRTPLGTVNNVFSFLNDGQLGELTEKGSRFVSSGMRNTERMMSLINDLLDIEKIKSGSFEIDFDEIDIQELLRTVQDLHTTAASAQGIQLSVSSAEGTVWGEHDKIVRMISNLIGNAIKFTPKDGKILLSASSDGKETRISVEDTGPGIPKEKAAMIFERYQQLEGEQKTSGSGLGLAICKMFAEAHGGRIWVESEGGKGSQFHIVLPAQKPS